MDKYLKKRPKLETQSDSNDTALATTSNTTPSICERNLQKDENTKISVSTVSVCTSSDEKLLPSFLTKEQWDSKFKEHAWLIFENGAFGCSACKKAGTLGAYKSERLKISPEWSHCQVKAFGDTDSKKQQAIRKKIFDHKNSASHTQCIIISERREKNEILECTARQEAVYAETTCRVFRTVYTLAKLNRPFTDLPTLIDMQKNNGADMGTTLHSDHLAADISGFISEEMKNSVISQIVKHNLKLGVMIDESTTVSHKSTLVVCLRTYFPNSDEASSFFLDMTELSSNSSECIHGSLKNVLNKYFTPTFLTKNFLSFAADGASNMLGRVSGVATKLQNEYPDLLTWHCANHRLELTVGDVIAKISEINHMKIFFDKLYCLFNASPKNRKQLSDCAAATSVKLQSIGRVLGTRWVSSSARSVKAIWNDYPALAFHFQNAVDDNMRDTKERAMYKGLLNRLTDVSFVLNMGLMLDALNELEDLSLQLQKRDITILNAHMMIQRKIQVFHSLQSRSGEYFQEATNAAQSKLLKGVQLHGPGRVQPISEKVFYESLVSQMEKRMLTTQASSSAQSAMPMHLEQCKKKYTDLLSNLEVFEKNKWPEDVTADICFGDDKIRNLCHMFGVVEVRKAVTAFREYAAESLSAIPDDLKPLMQAIKTIIISTAECERVFSAMNRTLTPIRNQLQIDTVNKLLFLNLCGPPVRDFKPQSYVKLWLSKGRRSADETRCRKRTIVDEKAPPGLESIWKILKQ